MEEGKDYIVIPAPHANEQAWQVCLLNQYKGVEVVYGNIKFDKGLLKYNFNVTNWPDAFEPDGGFNDYVGDVLEAVLAKGIQEQYIVLSDSETGEPIELGNNI